MSYEEAEQIINKFNSKFKSPNFGHGHEYKKEELSEILELQNLYEYALKTLSISK